MKVTRQGYLEFPEAAVHLSGQGSALGLLWKRHDIQVVSLFNKHTFLVLGVQLQNRPSLRVKGSTVYECFKGS